MRYALIALLLTGCATTQPGEPMPVKWVELEEQALQKTCNDIQNRQGLPRKSSLYLGVASYSVVNGCAERSGGMCTIYTRKADPLNRVFQQTIGHEVLHCFLGFYHDRVH